MHSFSGLREGEAGVGPPCGEGGVPQTLDPCPGQPYADLHLSASLSRDAATCRGRIGTYSCGWGRRGLSGAPPGLHLCHLGLPEDRPLLQAPWSPAAGLLPRGAVCRLRAAAPGLAPGLAGPERDAS
ncbi:unnamed protein product [Pipistrellus nathusii]|uniref:Uncharacterized protein n=1 Tax=Pipistrellus nathusii TaxID=59473 RepID=A0ABN9ZUA7_PIPNA